MTGPATAIPTDPASDPRSPSYFRQTVGDRVLFAVGDGDKHVHDRESSQDSVLHDALDTLFDRGAEGLRDRPAKDLPLVDETGPLIHRLQTHRDLGKLSRATGLLLVAVLAFGRCRDRRHGGIRNGRY